MPTQDPYSPYSTYPEYPILQKLGEALYIHTRQRESAEKAEAAVDYLTQAGVLTND